MNNIGRLWESFLAFAIFVSGGLTTTDVFTVKQLSVICLVIGGLQVATSNFKHGEARGVDKTLNPPTQVLPIVETHSPEHS